MENQEPQYEEIDLREYIKVLWNRKWSIITIFLIAVVLSAVISILTPPTYESSSLLEIGKIKGENMQSVNEIKSVFERETTLKNLREKLKNPLEITEETNTNTIKSLFDLKEVENGKEGAKFIKISGRSDTPEKSVKVVDAVSNILLEYHDQKFATAKKTFESELAFLKQKKSKAEADLKEDIKALKKEKAKDNEDIKGLNQEIAKTKANINDYQRQIATRANITSEGQGRIVESYIELLDKSNLRLEEKEQQIRDLKQQIVVLDQKIKEKESNLKQRLADFNTKIQQKEFEGQYKTTPTKIEVVASPPETRIAPNRKLNVLIAGILGGFIGILYAFGAEYFSQDKDNEEVNKEIDQEIIEE